MVLVGFVWCYAKAFTNKAIKDPPAGLEHQSAVRFSSPLSWRISTCQ